MSVEREAAFRVHFTNESRDKLESGLRLPSLDTPNQDTPGPPPPALRSVSVFVFAPHSSPICRRMFLQHKSVSFARSQIYGAGDTFSSKFAASGIVVFMTAT